MIVSFKVVSPSLAALSTCSACSKQPQCVEKHACPHCVKCVASLMLIEERQPHNEY